LTSGVIKLFFLFSNSVNLFISKCLYCFVAIENNSETFSFHQTFSIENFTSSLLENEFFPLDNN
jgi:hypothetical protein